MKKIKFSYISFFLLFLILILLSTISASLAWLSSEGSKDVTLIPGSFVVSTIVKDSTTNLTPINGVFTLNGLTRENNDNALSILGEENYVQYSNTLIEEMQININLKAEIAGYMRVKLQDEWIVTRKYINFDRTSTNVIFKDTSTNKLYTLAANWVYDNNTNFFYYTELIEENFDGTIPFVEAGKAYSSSLSSYYVETCAVNISISVQVVQANRYEAIWGIASIPQPTVETGGEI